MIRLYGIEKGNASWARVTAGVRHGITHHNKFAGFYDVSSVDADWDDDSLGVGYEAPVGIAIGPPPTASVMTGRGQHEHRLLMVAANSSWLPAALMEQAAKFLTGFLAPSYWSADIIRKYVDKPVYVYQHGVEDGFWPQQDARADTPPTPYRVLHMASTHMQRKGTKELIHGWAIAKREKWLPPEAVLRLVADGPRGYFLQPIHKASAGDLSIADSYELLTRVGLSVEAMAKFYCQHDVVCQPSRGEGFGMVPLEARACGVPAIATACTGHQEHSVGGVAMVVVPHGDDAPVDDGPGALAPTVDPHDIAVALGHAYENRSALSANALDRAGDIGKSWSWEKVTSLFLRAHGSELGIYP